MSEHHPNLKDILYQYRSINQNQSYIKEIKDILDEDINLESKGTYPMYFSKEVYEEWRRFCKTYPGKSMCELTDKALIYAMLNIPNKYVLIQIDMTEKEKKQQSLDSKLQEMICVDKLEKFLKKLKQINGGVRINHKEEFLAIIKECKKINIRSEKLSSLISEAMTHFE